MRKWIVMVTMLLSGVSGMAEPVELYAGPAFSSSGGANECLADWQAWPGSTYCTNANDNWITKDVENGVTQELCTTSTTAPSSTEWDLRCITDGATFTCTPQATTVAFFNIYTYLRTRGTNLQVICDPNSTVPARMIKYVPLQTTHEKLMSQPNPGSDPAWKPAIIREITYSFRTEVVGDCTCE